MEGIAQHLDLGRPEARASEPNDRLDPVGAESGVPLRRRR
jgi:hypothetical protein